MKKAKRAQCIVTYGSETKTYNFDIEKEAAPEADIYDYYYIIKKSFLVADESIRIANHIVEADIKGFFDNVSHELLMEFIRIRIRDTTLLNLIEKFLKAGYVDAGLLVTSEEGTPQGSILSPMLANIFLHYVLDTWYETIVKSHVRGYCELVRYADDFIPLSGTMRSA